MANVKFVNNASTKLASALTSSGTTCTVLQGTGAQFPTLGTNEFFVGVIVDLVGNLEVVYVTAQDTDTFTITRAQEGTAALAFPEGSFFENRLTAGSLTALQTQITGVDNWVKEEITAIPGLVETATTAAEEAEASAIIAAAAVETTEDYMNSASSSATAALASAGLASGYADTARTEAQAASTSEAAAAASAVEAASYVAKDGATITDTDIDEDGHLLISFTEVSEVTTFDGTQDAWDALTDTEKEAYTTVYIYDEE